MAKVILFNLMTLDGFFEGPNADINWHNVDDEFGRFAIEQLDSAGALVFGRRTYEMMADFWPSPAGVEGDPETARRMNSLPKLVFSRTLADPTWTNTRLASAHVEGEIERLKKEADKDIFVFGSADLAVTLLRLGLLDEIRLLVNPLLLGSGNPMFRGLDGPVTLKFIDARPFGNGNVLLRYAL